MNGTCCFHNSLLENEWRFPAELCRFCRPSFFSIFSASLKAGEKALLPFINGRTREKQDRCNKVSLVEK